MISAAVMWKSTTKAIVGMPKLVSYLAQLYFYVYSDLLPMCVDNILEGIYQCIHKPPVANLYILHSLYKI